MSSDPFFSVIIPTYNRASTLPRAIDSVLNQSIQDYELIVVNDGSTDNTSKILGNYPNIRVITQKNKGVSAARNTGVSIAKAKWIAFLDSDDEWLENKLEHQKEYILQNSDLNLVHGDEIWIRNGKRVNPKKKHNKGGGDQFVQSLNLCVISPSCVCLTKQVLEEFNGFREDFEVCEDYDLWLKITSKYRIGYIEEFLIKKYGGHDDQLSRKYFAMDYWRVVSIYELIPKLNPSFKLKAIKVIQFKIGILIKGYRKHDNHQKVEELKQLLSSITLL